jgi:hypothetical protein
MSGPFSTIENGKAATYYKYIRYYPCSDTAKTLFAAQPSFESDFTKNSYIVGGKKATFHSAWVFNQQHHKTIENNVNPTATLVDRGKQISVLELALTLEKKSSDREGTMKWPFDQTITNVSDPDTDLGIDGKLILPAQGAVSIVITHKVELAAGESITCEPTYTLPGIAYSKPYVGGKMPADHEGWIIGTLYNTKAIDPRWGTPDNKELIFLRSDGYEQRRFHVMTDYTPIDKKSGKGLGNVRFPCAQPCPLRLQDLGKVELTINGTPKTYYGYMYYCATRPPDNKYQGILVPHAYTGYSFPIERSKIYYVLILWKPYERSLLSNK